MSVKLHNFLIIFAAYSCHAQQPLETQNVCQYDVLPPDIISGLESASYKILDAPDPKDYTEHFDKVQQNVGDLKTALVTLDTNGSEISIAELISKHQNQLGNMLTLITNLNIDMNKSIQNLYSKSSNTSNKLSDVMNSQSAITNLLYNVTEVLEEMTFTMKNMKPKEQTNDTSSLMLKQSEMYDMIQELSMKAKTEMPLKETISLLRKDKKRLQRKLTKMKLNKSRPTDCSDIYATGKRRSGRYKIYPNSCYCGRPVTVWCDMHASDPGWTVILSRIENSNPFNFTRSWAEYKSGFGDASLEYWIGNDVLHTMTSMRRYAVRIEVQNRSGKKRWGQWNDFSVSSESDKYRLSVSGFLQSSTIGKDVLRTHNKEQFTTYDYDNDSSYCCNCASKYKGGWWYGQCFDIHPTGVMGHSDKRIAVSTSHFYHGRKSIIPLKGVTIKIKPLYCSSQLVQANTDNLRCKNEVYP